MTKYTMNDGIYNVSTILANQGILEIGIIPCNSIAIFLRTTFLSRGVGNRKGKVAFQAMHVIPEIMN